MRQRKKKRNDRQLEGTRQTRRLGPLWILVVSVVGFIARAIYLAMGHSQKLFESLFLDSLTYAETAASIAAGSGVGAHPYLLSPLYPYLLAPFVGAGGVLDISAMQWVQAVFGSLTVGLTSFAAGRLIDQRGGILAGLLAALFGPLIFFDGAILVASLQTFLLTLAMVLLLPEGKSSSYLALGAGLALGLSAALRPTGLAVAVVVFLFILRDMWLRREQTGALRLRAGALLVGLALTVMPFAIRNLTQGGEAVLLSANGGVNFWIGNHGKASGLFVAPPGYDQETDPVGRKLASEALGHETTYRESSGWWRDRARGDIADAPMRWVALMLNKVIYFGHPHEIGQMVQDYAWHEEELWILRFPLDARFVLLLALLAPFGAWLKSGAGGVRRLRWPFVFVSSYAAALCLFFITSRHRIPIMPAAIVLASATLLHLWDMARDQFKQRRQMAILGGSLLIGCIGSFVLFDMPSAPFKLVYSDARKLFNQGQILHRQDRSREAIPLFEQSLAQRDDIAVRFELAGALLKLGRWKEAEKHLDIVVRMNPASPTAWSNLGFIYETQDKELERARDAYLQAVRYAPEQFPTYFRLTVVYLQLDRPDLALGAIETFFSKAPPGSPLRQEAQKMQREASRRLERQ